jgi:hypothetical protein
VNRPELAAICARILSPQSDSLAPQQLRFKVSMNDDDKGLLETAFEAAVLAVKYAFRERWQNAHLLAFLEIDNCQFLTGVVGHDNAGGFQFDDMPGRREMALRHYGTK